MDYVNEGYSNRQLSIQKNKNEYLVRKYIQNQLDTNKLQVIDIIYERVKYIMIDGYHLPGGQVLLVYYEYVIGKVIWFSIGGGETKDLIEKDLKVLKNSFGYNIKACFMDGSKSIFSAMKSVYPDIIIQRCLVHIQRQVFAYITKNPKLKQGKQLKHLVSYRILSDSFLFPLLFKIWKCSNSQFLSEKTPNSKGKNTFKHKNIRRAMKHIENALPYMFQRDKYNDRNIEFSTNRLEGYFGVLTNECINEHKGIREDRLWSLLALWIYFRNER